MGLIWADIELIRGADLVLFREKIITKDKIRKLKTKALVDSGAYMLAINEAIKHQLDLHKTDERIAEMADGSKKLLEVVGPIEIRFENRRTSVDAMVLPGDSEVLLGAIPLEDLDVVLDMKNQKLIVNPESPYISKKPLKK